jgi:hypothetical protein
MSWSNIDGRLIRIALKSNKGLLEHESKATVSS